MTTVHFDKSFISQGCCRLGWSWEPMNRVWKNSSGTRYPNHCHEAGSLDGPGLIVEVGQKTFTRRHFGFKRWNCVLRAWCISVPYYCTRFSYLNKEPTVGKAILKGSFFGQLRLITRWSLSPFSFYCVFPSFLHLFLSLKVPTLFDSESLNMGAAPCEDFYRFACGSWRPRIPWIETAFKDMVAVAREDALRFLQTSRPPHVGSFGNTFSNMKSHFSINGSGVLADLYASRCSSICRATGSVFSCGIGVRTMQKVIGFRPFHSSRYRRCFQDMCMSYGGRFPCTLGRAIWRAN